jgi:competence ComEA-like helix-hairpin-helix protein
MPNIDPFSILLTDHEHVRELFARLGRSAADPEALEQLGDALEQHTELEEEVLYPAFRDVAAGTEHEHRYFESIEAHNLVELMLTDLDDDGLGLDASAFAAKIHLLERVVMQHLQEEEAELFVLIRQLCSADQLDALGERLWDRHEQLGALALGQRPSGDESGGDIDINEASAEQLRQLEGVDEIRADKIVAFRESHGRFEDWEDLRQVEGIDHGMVRVIRDQARLG